MNARLLRASDRAARPWKNGGGVTHDIAVSPEDADDGDFLWRASVATIAAPGPFSLFPGVDRALMLLRGRLIIDVGGGSAQALEPGAPALLFSGEAPVQARPAGEACQVLNIMARRGGVSIALNRWTKARSTNAGTLLLFAPSPIRIATGSDGFELQADDALLLNGPGEPISLSGAVIAAEFFL